ncbi:hypothetical protein M231_02454 [Tremella mesenterica]|uniref:Uncharacterized protein n=1 Tax=Tremella mesenterica TaxID=5217 RepID=A0A4Q1BQL8_TREME|nr:hypothetical protein M231_02454 [Tremella mesenterica]
MIRPLLFALGLVSTFGGALAKERMTNADRFKRGLPPLAPGRRYDPTATHALVSRVSDDARQAIIQASPPPGQGNRKREGDPTVDTSYLSYSFNGDVFYFTTNIDAAMVFTLGEAGSEQTITFNDGENERYLCSRVWRTPKDGVIIHDDGRPSASVYFGGCSGSTSTEEAYGSEEQIPIWTIPTDLPGDVISTFFNNDETTSSYGYWIFNDNVDDLPYTLGGAEQNDDFQIEDQVTTIYTLFFLPRPV